MKALEDMTPEELRTLADEKEKEVRTSDMRAEIEDYNQNHKDNVWFDPLGHTMRHLGEASLDKTMPNYLVFKNVRIIDLQVRGEDDGESHWVYIRKPPLVLRTYEEVRNPPGVIPVDKAIFEGLWTQIEMNLMSINNTFERFKEGVGI